MHFQNFWMSLVKKINKIWLNQVSEFYNRSMKLWLHSNDIEMYLPHKGARFVGERFSRTLKNKICKHMTVVSKHLYIDKLDEIVHKYNNIYHGTIRMKPLDVKPGMYIDYGVKHNDKDPKYKVGDHVRISKYKNIFATAYQIGLRKSFWSKKGKILYPGHKSLVI